MPRRYEVSGGPELEIVGPGDDAWEAILGDDFDEDAEPEPGQFALSIGNPWASAYAVLGTHESFERFAIEILMAVQRHREQVARALNGAPAGDAVEEYTGPTFMESDS